MNLSTVVTRIKLQLGIINIATPIENLDETIVEIIQNITVPVFSLYAPYKKNLYIRTSDMELIEKTAEYERYILPDFGTEKLLYVYDVKYDTGQLSGLASYGAMPYYGGNLIQQIMMGNASMNVYNQIIPKMTFKFMPPRELMLYNVYSYTKVVLELGFQHDKSLITIPETASESFFKLALLDTMDNLYPTIKQYNELQTAIGTINLRLDEWQSASDKRDELLREWDDTYHLDWKPMYFA
jgi:hypothetical protein